MKKVKNLIILIVSLLCITACKKMVEVNPPITSTNGDNVFNEDGTAISLITGVYTNMSNGSVASPIGWLTNISFTTGLTGDELIPYNLNDPTFGPFYNNNISPTDNSWVNMYEMIFVANSAIEKLPNGTFLTSAVRKQLLGEAKFIRALNYFYLINIYGNVPLATSTDYQINRLLPRTETSKIYDLIKADLTDAQNLLSDKFLGKDLITVTTERVRPTKWAATALLARVDLYTNNYADAESQSSSIIANTSSFSLVDLDTAFLSNNSEAIWQLQPTGSAANQAANTREESVYDLLPLSPNAYRVYLNQSLVNSFDARDQRRTHWIDSVIVAGKVLYFPYKYKIGAEVVPTKEYSTVFRLAEQYLIRAEARINEGKISEGISDLNFVRQRASNLLAPSSGQLPMLSPNLSKDAALLAVEEERRFELFTEWGHRWLDLKRTNRTNQVLQALKPGYQTTDQLFPIPQNDILLDPNLSGQQNPGY